MPIEFVFDYASPWSFLASQLIPRLLPGADIVYVPVYLRGFEMFAGGVPYTGAKMAYIMKDLGRCAAHAKVALASPHSFPVNGIHALRGAVAAQRLGVFDAYHAVMFKAVWQESRDVADKQVVAAIARAAGLDGVPALLDDQGVKDAVRANTERAVARGAFGVPAFFVGEELFWGQDRMHLVAEAARLVPPA